MKKEIWQSKDTCVYFGDGGIDIRNSPDAFNRARLIASAPDLLEALEKAREDINWMLNSRQFLNADVFNYIDSAIAKARGQND